MTHLILTPQKGVLLFPFKDEKTEAEWLSNLPRLRSTEVAEQGLRHVQFKGLNSEPLCHSRWDLGLTVFYCLVRKSLSYESNIKICLEKLIPLLAKLLAKHLAKQSQNSLERNSQNTATKEGVSQKNAAKNVFII